MGSPTLGLGARLRAAWRGFFSEPEKLEKHHIVTPTADFRKAKQQTLTIAAVTILLSLARPTEANGPAVLGVPFVAGGAALDKGLIATFLLITTVFVYLRFLHEARLTRASNSRALRTRESEGLDQMLKDLSDNIQALITDFAATSVWLRRFRESADEIDSGRFKRLLALHPIYRGAKEKQANAIRAMAKARVANYETDADRETDYREAHRDFTNAQSDVSDGKKEIENRLGEAWRDIQAAATIAGEVPDLPRRLEEIEAKVSQQARDYVSLSEDVTTLDRQMFVWHDLRSVHAMVAACFICYILGDQMSGPLSVIRSITHVGGTLREIIG